MGNLTESRLQGQLSGGRSQPSPRAIVAEDDPDCRLGVAVLLRHLGYEVTMARNGREALAWFRSFGGVALLVTDLAMPSMDGLALTKRVRALEPNTPVVAISGAGPPMMEHFESRIERGMSVLPKPFDRVEFNAAVARATLRA
jgi:CheY-like chemotaxis protein